MRLSADQVKHAILGPDRDVREAAIYYFAQSYSLDPSIMPLAIQAIEQHGWKGAFEFYSFMRDLAQTDETVLWLVGQVKKCGEPNEEFGYVNAIRSALIHADADLLKHHDSKVLAIDELDEKTKGTVRERIRLASQSAEELWHQLQDFCERSDNLDKVPDDLDLADDLVEALGRHPEFSASKVMSILNGETGDSENWLELSMVRLAGELRLQEAIPHIVVLLSDADYLICEEGHRALVKIGGDKVVEELARGYLTGNADLQSSAACIFEDIHTDLSVDTCRRLFETEKDHCLRCRLLQSMLMNFSTDGIEPARQFILETPLDPEVLEVRHDLLTACKVLGESFPELEAWTVDAKNDTEFRKNWYRKNPLMPSLDEIDLDDDEELDDFAPVQSAMVREVRIGRNDPCPCGSGKKFKKCCLKNGSSAI